MSARKPRAPAKPKEEPLYFVELPITQPAQLIAATQFIIATRAQWAVSAYIYSFYLFYYLV